MNRREVNERTAGRPQAQPTHTKRTARSGRSARPARRRVASCPPPRPRDHPFSTLWNSPPTQNRHRVAQRRARPPKNRGRPPPDPLCPRPIRVRPSPRPRPWSERCEAPPGACHARGVRTARTAGARAGCAGRSKKNGPGPRCPGPIKARPSPRTGGTAREPGNAGKPDAERAFAVGERRYCRPDVARAAPCLGRPADIVRGRSVRGSRPGRGARGGLPSRSRGRGRGRS